MDGLVKVGKTTTSPSQRMVELHSTGVPTPFVIEFAAEVDDCHACEKAAHRVLAKYRLSSNREFFRTTVRHAIAEMLPVLGEYRLIDVRESHGIEKIESDLTRKREEIAAQERKRNAERAQQAQARTLKYRTELTAIQGQLAIARAKLAALGPQPVRPQAGSLAVLLFFCRLPIPPLGLAIWLGTLMIFKTELQTGGLVCLAILVASFLSRAHEKEKEQKYNMAARPFEPLEHEIGELEARIAAISVPSQAASAPTPANTVQSNRGAVVASMSKSRAA